MAELTFYSIHDCEGTVNVSCCLSFIHKHAEIIYPCLILVRRNNWNDHNYYTHFDVYYIEKQDGEIYNPGIIKIIQSKEINDYKTTLPEQFNSLSKTEFFSKGTIYFYSELNNPIYVKIKSQILSALNEICYCNYSKEQILQININLRAPYENSLFRDDDQNYDVSSEYAKDSLNMLDKIHNCAISINNTNESHQKIMLNLLFGSIIVTLESYLGDAFKYLVINNKNYYQSFLRFYKFPRGEPKLGLKELGLRGNQIGEYISNEIKKTMNEIIFHRIDIVKGLYKDILNIDLPPKLMDFQDAIEMRHNIFHRNGKTIVGTEINIQISDVIRLIVKVKKFINETEHIIAAQTNISELPRQ